MNQPSAGAATAPRMLTRARVVGAGITLFWLVMMLTLVKDRILPEAREARLTASAKSPAELVAAGWQDQVEGMDVMLGKKQVGVSLTSIKRKREGQFTVYEADFGISLQLNLAGLGIGQAISVRGKADLDSSFTLRRFRIASLVAGYKLDVVGVGTSVNGEELLLEVTQGAQAPALSRIALERPISLLEAVRPLATRSMKIEEGATLAVPVVDPIWSMQQGTLQLTVGKPIQVKLSDGVTTTGFPVTSRLNDYVSKSVVDVQGRTLKRELVAGLTMERAQPDRVRRQATELARPIVIPELDMKRFDKIPAQKLQRLSEDGRSPVEALKSILPSLGTGG